MPRVMPKKRPFQQSPADSTLEAMEREMDRQGYSNSPNERPFQRTEGEPSYTIRGIKPPSQRKDAVARKRDRQREFLKQKNTI